MSEHHVVNLVGGPVDGQSCPGVELLPWCLDVSVTMELHEWPANPKESGRRRLLVKETHRYEQLSKDDNPTTYRHTGRVM